MMETKSTRPHDVKITADGAAPESLPPHGRTLPDEARKSLPPERGFETSGRPDDYRKLLSCRFRRTHD